MTPGEFWYEWGRRGGASEAELAVAEASVGHRFPDEFRDLLLAQDGGICAFSEARLGKRRISVLPFLGVGANSRSGDIARGYAMRAMEQRPDHIIVFSAQGESWWGFDYRRVTVHPRIVYQLDWDSDIEVVADSFRAFLDSLVDS